MRFAVVDDYAPEAKALETLIGGYCARHFIGCEISIFHTAGGFSAVFAPGRFDVLFLDIYLEPEQESGIELGRECMKADSALKLVFCTSSPDFAVEGFRMNAANYLLKPVSAESVDAALTRLADFMERDARYITVLSQRIKADVFLKDVVYAEVDDDQTTIHTVAGESLVINQTLGELENEIRAIGDGGVFVRCHKSYLVNMNHVLEADGRGDFLMANGKKAYVRVKGGHTGKRLLFDYKVEQARRM